MFKDLKTQAHLKPGQKGTKKLMARYADALLCLRYRHDKDRGVRMKTWNLSWKKRRGRLRPDSALPRSSRWPLGIRRRVSGTC